MSRLTWSRSPPRVSTWRRRHTTIWTQATSLVTSTLAGEIASRQVLRYASYAYDAESGLYYCSARYYDPATRQWTTGDPGKADGEESAWQYCSGDPVQGVDPAGKEAKKLHTTDSITTSVPTGGGEMVQIHYVFIGDNYYISASSAKWKHIKFRFRIKETSRKNGAGAWQTSQYGTKSNVQIFLCKNYQDSNGCQYLWTSDDDIISNKWYVVNKDTDDGTVAGTPLQDVRTPKLNGDGTRYSCVFWRWRPDVPLLPDTWRGKPSKKF